MQCCNTKSTIYYTYIILLSAYIIDCSCPHSDVCLTKQQGLILQFVNETSHWVY